MIATLMFILAETTQSGSVEIGWLGGAGVGGASIVTAVIVLWKRSESVNKDLIDTHKQRADEAEARTKEVTEVLAAETETRKAFADAMNAVANSNHAVAESLKMLSNAIGDKR